MAKNLNTQIQTQTQISNPETQTQTLQISIEKINQIKNILKQYLEDKISISHAADQIIEVLHPWYEYYMPLLAYHIDPWQKRANDVLSLEDTMDRCAEVSSTDEEFIDCVISEVTRSYNS
jgi:hypothetical protein